MMVATLFTPQVFMELLFHASGELGYASVTLGKANMTATLLEFLF